MTEFSKKLEIPANVKTLVMISDIHGVLESLTELEPIIDELKADGPVQVVVLGDLLPGGCNPLEVLEWVRDKAGDFAVPGNHDLKMLKSPPEPAHMCTEKGVRCLLTQDQLEYLNSLPMMLELIWRGKKIVCVHGQVSTENQPLRNSELPEELFEKIGSPDADLAVSGHTHYPFVLKQNGRIVANTGSTSRQMYGISSKGGPVMSLETKGKYEGGKGVFSSCLIVKEKDGDLEVSVRKYDYDRADYVKKLEEIGDPWFDINKIIFETGIAYW